MNSLLTLRKNSGLSQEALADYLGVSRSLINLAEKGLRGLPKEAAAKLADIEKIIATAALNSKAAMISSEDKTSRQLKDYHKLKMEEYLYEVETLRRQLAIMLRSLQKADAKHKVVSGLAKNNPKSRKNRFADAWVEYHGELNNKKLSKYIPAIRTITYDIEVLIGYAAVHEKILKKIF